MNWKAHSGKCALSGLLSQSRELKACHPHCHTLSSAGGNLQALRQPAKYRSFQWAPGSPSGLENWVSVPFSGPRYVFKRGGAGWGVSRRTGFSELLNRQTQNKGCFQGLEFSSCLETGRAQSRRTVTLTHALHKDALSH